ncbi:YycC family protein [Paenibacillus wynnii]|uniref:YycC family protein n=1 Tax=Paenibacillus wynnii TaxID=268407 RepID=UPI0027943E5E|nr:YycC family protein [Paenibacillus wynnii]MDQ0193857.1 plasmid maintenance system antidote protein VapI [Paenibacillus wynnii]
MRPLQISPETAIALSKQLGVPLEHLMHMPQHILLQKIAELSRKVENPATGEDLTSESKTDDPSARKDET